MQAPRAGPARGSRTLFGYVIRNIAFCSVATGVGGMEKGAHLAFDCGPANVTLLSDRVRAWPRAAVSTCRHRRHDVNSLIVQKLGRGGQQHLEVVAGPMAPAYISRTCRVRSVHRCVGARRDRGVVGEHVQADAIRDERDA